MEKKVAFLYPAYKNEIGQSIAYKSSLFYTLESLYWKERIAQKPKKFLQKNGHNIGDLKASSFQCCLQHSQRVLLEQLQAKTGASIQQLTIAALLIYFGKTTGLSQFILGILLHKRESKQMRNVVGMFSSILPFKAKFNPDIKLIDFLKELRVEQKKDYRHKNYLSGEISRSLHINPAEENLCDIIVNHELLNFELDFSNELEATVVQLSSESELIPLQICWQEFGNGQPLQLQMIFREDYFTGKEIELLTERILFILEQFPIKFEALIGAIDIIPPAERQILQSFNNTDTNYPNDISLIALFQQQVKNTPSRVAVVFEETQLTYEQLNDKGNRLAHYLKGKGVKEEELIPICISRSLEMIIGIIGILKCGATYVPVDPAYPEERISHILKETKAKVIITNSGSQNRLPLLKNVTQIIIDKEWTLIEEQLFINLNLKASLSSLSYIIYTSGSTGKPKGVQMPEANLVNLLMWQNGQFDQTYRHVLQYASLNFDVSFQEIFSTLCFGSSLYLISEQQRSNMFELSTLMHRYGITHLFLPCIVLKILAEHFANNQIHLPQLQKIIVAGEQLQLTNDINQLVNAGITIINQYGPTEAHVVSSYTIDNNFSSALPPIGKPISNNSIYILDDQLQLLPLGVAGEICITGAGVAKGYLANEQLTAEKFLLNPFGKGKMYRTGDIGRWLPDGNIQFLGRSDDQVKIRGYRVELGEIESMLQQCSLVKQCVVVVKENKEGTKLLLCYVVPNQQFNKNAIVTFLEGKLPSYMIPAVYIPLSVLPVTINGKVDKNALPSVDVLIKDKYAAPKTVMESVLVKIWQEVLGVDQVSRQDNFFELGGHSLLVIKMMAKIKQQTGRNMPPGALFQHPTVEKFARALLEKQPAENNRQIVTIKKGMGKMPLYIICHIGVAPISRFVPFAGLLSHDQPVYGIQLPETDGLNAESISIEGIASKYVADLLIHNPNGPFAFAGYSLGGIIAVEMAKQLKVMGKKVVLLCLFDTVAYTKKTPQAPTPLNNGITKQQQLYFKLKSAATDSYYKIDNHLYLLKFNTKNALWRIKNHFIRIIKTMLRIKLTLEQKTKRNYLARNCTMCL